MSAETPLRPAKISESRERVMCIARDASEALMPRFSSSSRRRSAAGLWVVGFGTLVRSRLMGLFVFILSALRGFSGCLRSGQVRDQFSGHFPIGR